MRALVTGCAGFIGSHLSESLLADGHDVIGVDCFNDNYGRAQKLRNLDHARAWDNFDFVPIDLARGALMDVVADCDTIFHLAAEPGVRASWGERFELYLRNNVLATQHLLEATRPWPGKRFVFASSSSVYGQAESFPTPEDATPRPFSPYGVTKLDAEHLCLLYNANHGIDTVCLRYFSVYGPRQRPDMAFNIFCQAALAGEPVTVFGDGRQTRDFTFVLDAVAATRAAAVRPPVSGRVCNVGGGSQVSLMDAIDLIQDLAGRPVDMRFLDSREGDVRNTGADTARATKGLGFSPSTDLDEGLAAEFEWVLDSRRSALAGS